MRETTVPEPYWGIICTTCEERIVLGRRLDAATGDMQSFLKPGSFVCIRGHRHLYHSDDLECFPFEELLPDSKMESNRKNYKYLPDPTS
jgi:hypothetical protein